MFGITVTDPVDDHRVRAADALRDQPRRDVHAATGRSPSSGRRPHDHDRPLGRGAHPAAPPPPRGARDGAGPGAIFQADLGRLKTSSRRVPRATEPPRDAAPPRRRDLRAVPGALRAAAAGPRARRHPPVGRVRAVRPAAVPPARGGRDARRLRHGPGHRVVPQRPLPGLQVVGRDAARAARPVPDRRGRGRGARDRPLADGRVRGRRRDRRGRRRGSARTGGSSGSSSARRTRTWPSSSATTGSCSGTGAATSSTTTPGCAPSGAWRRRRSRTGSGSSATPRTAFRACPAGAPSPRRPCSTGTATSRTIPPKASAWEVPGVGGSRAIALAATLRDHWDEALLYRDLARSADRRRRRPDPPARPRRAALGRRAARRRGRRSARNGASTVSGRGPIAGSEPTRPVDAVARLADEREQRLVVRRRRGEDPDRLRAVARGRTTGRRPSR